MIFWCDYGTSLGLSLLWDARIFSYSWLHAQMYGSHALRKVPWYNSKCWWDWKCKSKSSIMSCQLFAYLICVNLFIQICYWWACRPKFSTQAWWHVEIAESKFEFQCLVSCSFNIGDVTHNIIFEMCILEVCRGPKSQEWERPGTCT